MWTSAVNVPDAPEGGVTAERSWISVSVTGRVWVGLWPHLTPSLNAVKTNSGVFGAVLFPSRLNWEIPPCYNQSPQWRAHCVSCACCVIPVLAWCVIRSSELSPALSPSQFSLRGRSGLTTASTSLCATSPHSASHTQRPWTEGDAESRPCRLQDEPSITKGKDLFLESGWYRSDSTGTYRRIVQLSVRLSVRRVFYPLVPHVHKETSESFYGLQWRGEFFDKLLFDMSSLCLWDWEQDEGSCWEQSKHFSYQCCFSF